MNKQPFYNEVTILFTTTREMNRAEVERLIQEKLKHRDIVRGSVTLDNMVEPEPGDPADLMG